MAHPRASKVCMLFWVGGGASAVIRLPSGRRIRAGAASLQARRTQRGVEVYEGAGHREIPGPRRRVREYRRHEAAAGARPFRTTGL